jgi:hypothetical protein
VQRVTLGHSADRDFVRDQMRTQLYLVRQAEIAYTLAIINGNRRRFMPASKAAGARSARNVETKKKKARRAAPRKKTTRIAGNTLGARTRLKKMAGKKAPAKKATKARKAIKPTKKRA